ncbi:hypothetical protein C8R47DRAFT_477262 [Mycena vitilis]|nr:hypothetical protein C8R47DRAFT_477262 [Mycena vitilis]
MRDAMARLPLELSSEIFLQCLPLEPNFRKPDAATSPMLLMNVCNAWTAIALSTPALWAGIHPKHPNVDLLDVWLQRAENHPLSISPHNSFSNDVATSVGRQNTRVKHLWILEKEFRVNVGTLAGLATFLSLESLLVEAEVYLGNDGRECVYDFDFPELMGLLRLAPNLTDCSLHNVNLAGYTGEMLILPRLRSLKLGKYPWTYDCSDDRVLVHLSLPSLETLALPLIR